MLPATVPPIGTEPAVPVSCAMSPGPAVRSVALKVKLPALDAKPCAESRKVPPWVAT